MLRSILILLCVVGLSACSTPPQQKAQSAYENEKAALDVARAAGTSAALDEFLRSYPQTLWAETAIYWRDHAALEEAKRIGTKEAFQAFLLRHPKSMWAEHARYYIRYGVDKEEEANPSLVPATGGGTSAADAPVAPGAEAAHL